MAHGVKAGLFGSPRDWLGAHCAGALLDREVFSGRRVDRTLEKEAVAEDRGRAEPVADASGRS